MKTLDEIRKLPHVMHVDDERSQGNSIIVTLEEGWFFTKERDCGVRGFDTVSEAKQGTSKKAVFHQVRGEDTQAVQQSPAVVETESSFVSDMSIPPPDAGTLQAIGWQEFTHKGQRWSFNEDELAKLNSEDGEFHFYAYHGLNQPNADQVIDFIEGNS